MRRDVEECFIKRERFDEWSESKQDIANFGRIMAINFESGRHNDQLGTSLQGLEGWHRGPNPKFARLVVTGCQYASAISWASYAHRFTGQFGMIANFDCGIKAVHVELDDFTRRRP